VSGALGERPQSPLLALHDWSSVLTRQ
jgi:hypothetical protein